jgi:hypothetical protein
MDGYIYLFERYDQDDPLIELFGKDIANLIYRIIHEMNQTDVISEYRGLLIGHPCIKVGCMCTRLKFPNDIMVYNYREYGDDFDINVRIRDIVINVPANYWVIKELY